jgi:hypothetical protein
MAIAESSYSDERQVTLGLALSSPKPLVSPRSGILTSYACNPGAEISSGMVLAALDERPIIVLRTKSPLWRSLVGGEQGADVSGLQEALANLGYTVDATGVFDWQTRVATQEFYADRGMRSDALNFESVVWIANDSVIAESCPATIGAPTAAGAPLVALRNEITSVRVAPMPKDLVAGDRQLTVGETTLTLDDTGTASPDSGDYAKLAGEPSVIEFLSTEGDRVLTGMLTLADPARVLTVPPSSVFGAGGNQCISDGDDDYRISIVASRLGSTLVELKDPSTVPLQVLVDGPPGRSCG